MKTRPPALTEHQEQSLVIQWFNSYAPTKGVDPLLLFAIPNAAKRSYRLASYLKAEGMRKGMLDLFLAQPRLSTQGGPLLPGLFIEMKRVGEKATAEQVEYVRRLTKAGYVAVVCQGADEAMRAIKAYLR